MATFIYENAGTGAVVVVLAAVVALIITKLVRDKRTGKCAGCSCGCGGDKPEGCGQ